jgi:hypothetical protein
MILMCVQLSNSGGRHAVTIAVCLPLLVTQRPDSLIHTQDYIMLLACHFEGTVVLMLEMALILAFDAALKKRTDNDSDAGDGFHASL